MQGAQTVSNAVAVQRWIRVRFLYLPPVINGNVAESGLRRYPGKIVTPLNGYIGSNPIVSANGELKLEILDLVRV